jgi:replication factor A1
MILEENKVFNFKSGQVKMANKKFTSIKNDFCITFSDHTEITPASNDNRIKGKGYNFTKLSSVNELIQYQTIDVIGVVIK